MPSSNAHGRTRTPASCRPAGLASNSHRSARISLPGRRSGGWPTRLVGAATVASRWILTAEAVASLLEASVPPPHDVRQTFVRLRGGADGSLTDHVVEEDVTESRGGVGLAAEADPVGGGVEGAAVAVPQVQDAEAWLLP